jgi:prevent-host-death family protein
MTQVPIQEAQDNLEELLSRVEEGETILITRPGHSPVRLSPMQEGEGSLPSLRQWRERLQIDGAPLSEAVQSQRNEGRY